MANHPPLSVRLAALKAAMNIRSNEDLAARLGCSRAMLYLYESGKNEPTLKFVEKLKSLENSAGLDIMINPSNSSNEAEGWKTRAIEAEKKLDVLASILRAADSVLGAKEAGIEFAEPDEPAEIVDLNPALPRHVKIIRKRTNDNTETKDSSA